MPRWKIRVVSGISSGQVFDLAKERVRIGRSRGDIRLPEDARISGAHAELHFERARGCWAIRDMHSANGTRVNGVPVFVKNLNPGDKIKIGSTELLLEENSVTGELAALAPGGDVSAPPAPAPSGPPKLSVIQGGAETAGGSSPDAVAEASPEGAKAEDKPKRRADVVDDFIQVMSAPGRFFEKLAESAPGAKDAAVFLVVLSGVSGVLVALLAYYGFLGTSRQAEGVLRTLVLLSPVAWVPAIQLVSSLAGAALVWVLAKILGGLPTFARCYESVGYSFAPIALSPLFLAIPSYGARLSAIPMLYAQYLLAVSLIRLHRLKPGPSYGVCALFAAATLAGAILARGL